MMMIGFPFYFFLVLLFSASLGALARRSHPPGPAVAGPHGASAYASDLPEERAAGSLQREWEIGVFRLAARYGGRLTLSDVVIWTGLTLREAEKLLDRLVDGAHVRLEVGSDGLVVYEFPEIISRAGAENASRANPDSGGSPA